jgi:hypothetical protein
MATEVWIEGDVDAAFREYLEAVLGPGMVGRVQHAAVDGPLPQVVVMRLGGYATDISYQIDVWANTRDEAWLYTTIIVGGIETAAEAWFSLVPDARARIIGTRVESIRWMPDDLTNVPRYVVEATVAGIMA